MAAYPSRLRRLRKRLNRRLYGALVRAYRALFPTPRWEGRIPPARLRRLLIVQRYGVGDMILTTPLIAFLKERAPEAEIDVLASPRNAAVIGDDDRVARVFVHDHSWRGWLAVLPRLRRRRYDAIFSGQAGKGLAEGLLASLAARRETYKVSVWRPKRYHGLFTTVVRPPLRVQHVADRLLYMAHSALGGGLPRPTVARYPLRIGADARAAAIAEDFLTALGAEQYILVNVSAHFSTRDWDPAHCAAFASTFLTRHRDVRLVLTRAPRKAWQAERVAALCPSPDLVLAPAMPLLAVTALAQRALAVVTAETSLIHVASAYRRPVVALYAPESASEVAHWLPLGVPYRALVSRAGSGMTDVAPDDVADAVAAVCALRERVHA